MRILNWLLGVEEKNFSITLHDVRVIDGDTIEALVVIHPKQEPVQLAYGVTARLPPVYLEKHRVRLLNFDAYEMSDKPRGQLAKDALVELLSLRIGRLRLYPDGRGKRDNFGRLLGDIYVPTKQGLVDAAQWLAAKGHGELK